MSENNEGLPLVSVIIPTFNREQTLERAIESVLNQTFPNIELIIVDDGSTDSTELICEGKNLRYFKTENRGVSAARNFGIQQALGDWVAFLDSDDQWLPKKIQRQIEYSAENPEYNLIHCDEIWIRNGVRVNAHNKHKKGGGDQFCRSLKMCLISPSAVMMKKETLFELGLFREDFPCCEDYDLWLKFTSLYPVGFVEEKLLNKYGGHDDQLSQKYIAMDFWRVQSIDWIISQRKLSGEKHMTSRAVLLKKCRILERGYLKHNNLSNLKQIREIMSRYSKTREQV